MNQAPLLGLSPITLKRSTNNAIIRQIAQLTKVKPGEATPDGFPPIVLQAIRESIKKNEKAFNSNKGASQAGWAQMRCLEDALALLKKRVSATGANPASIAGPSSEASGIRTDEERQVRRRLDGGK